MNRQNIPLTMLDKNTVRKMTFITICLGVILISLWLTVTIHGSYGFDIAQMKAVRHVPMAVYQSKEKWHHQYENKKNMTDGMQHVKQLNSTSQSILYGTKLDKYLFVDNETNIEGTMEMPIVDKLMHIENLLETFWTKLGIIRNIVLNKPKVRSHNVTQYKRLFAYEFDKIMNEHAEVTTLTLKEEFKTIKPIMVSTYYPQLVENYTDISLKKEYIHTYGDPDKNVDFASDFEDQWKSKSDLKYNHFVTQFNLQFENNSSHVMLAYIHIIKEGTILRQGEVMVGQLSIHPGGCGYNQYNKRNRHSKKHFKEVFTITQYWGEGYFHALVEDITRLAPFLQFLKKYQFIKVHVKSVNGFVVDILSILGIEKGRLISGQIDADIIYIPAHSGCGKTSLFNAQLLSFYLQTLPTWASKHKSKKKSIILIKRSHKRWFKRHNDIFRLLQKYAINYGLEVKVFDDQHVPKVSVTMELFNNASIIVAPHGAGLSNVLFCNPGTVVIEGLCPLKIPNLCYGGLNYNLGNVYYGILPMFDCKNMPPSAIERPLMNYLKLLKHI